MALTTFPRFGSRRPKATTDVFDILGDLVPWQESVDAKAAIDRQGTLATRPAASVAGTYYFATDTGDTYRDDGTQWQRVGQRAVSARVRLTTTKSGVAGGATVDVAPVTVDEDTATAVNATNGTFTVPAGAGGMYLVTATYRADNATGTNGAGTIFIAINGTAKRPGAGPGSTVVNVVEASFARTFRLVAGDVVKLQYQGAGTTSNLAGVSTAFDTGFEITRLTV